MHDTIWIPRPMISEIIRNSQRPEGQRLHNVQVCVKIPYKGLEISIACDSSHTDGDLKRSDIRVFKGPGGEDISEFFYEGDQTMLYGYGEELHRIFQLADVYVKNNGEPSATKERKKTRESITFEHACDEAGTLHVVIKDNGEEPRIVAVGAGARGYDPAGG